MTTYLLDINVLLALADPMHVHHETAHVWFAEKGQSSWASCPLTENGFVRIASHPKYPNRPGDVSAVCSILEEVCKTPGYQFWAEDLSLLDILEPNAIITHAQITDVYLLGLAVHKDGRLATLDQRIPVDAVRGGRQALERLTG
ncbi:MAG: VapC toxin family PIN domain ribonuclease [Deltaproteobacteria bacterium]|nr:VapC toxin family PIN domain ribonuclease [Deltaproteobacteria bacterium]MBW2285259.1 VapC toxin family PIN domain ribonuclease [Deltaproteobacteria bacterium]